MKEHETICWQNKVKMRRAVIELFDSKTLWGMWDGETGSIKISRSLIENHSWDSVVAILKHEMAHQIVHDLFGSNEGHGLLFGKACEMINVPEDFRGATSDIPRKLVWIGDILRETEDKITRKVRKLLSLATSKNEHEAFAAMKKAQELMQKYNLSRIENRTSSTYTYKIINHKKKRIENYQRKISSILVNHFFVEVVYSDLFDAKKCESHKTIELLGTVENVLMAEYAYYFLIKELEILYEAHSKKHGKKGITYKRSYYLGVLRGFEKKLEGISEMVYQPKVTDCDMKALMKVEERILGEYIGTRFPRVSRTSSRASRVEYSSYNAGVSDGKKLNFRRGITKRSRIFGGFLTR